MLQHYVHQLVQVTQGCSLAGFQLQQRHTRTLVVSAIIPFLHAAVA